MFCMHSVYTQLSLERRIGYTRSCVPVHALKQEYWVIQSHSSFPPLFSPHNTIPSFSPFPFCVPLLSLFFSYFI